jgi:hypothetical protein
MEKLASQIGTDDLAFLKELKKAFAQNQTRLVEPENDSLLSLLNLEKHLVHLILSDKETAEAILLEINPEEFLDPALRTIVQNCQQKIDMGQDLKIDQLLDQTDDLEIRNILSRLGLESIEFDAPERTLKDCISKHKNIRLKTKIKDLKIQREQAFESGQIERSQELQVQLHELHLALTH